MKVLGIVGSLRKGSYNRGLMQAAIELKPDLFSLEVIGLEGIPLYNQDNELDIPEAVSVFKAKISAADAILIATPEYNYSIPGVLKNAIDWASRPKSVWGNKPVAIMGASPSLLGTARSQYHLRQVLVGLNMYPLSQPEMMVGVAHEKFSDNGTLTDEKTREKLQTFLVAFRDFAGKFIS